jgi:hypothetical protein
MAGKKPTKPAENPLADLSLKLQSPEPQAPAPSPVPAPKAPEPQPDPDNQPPPAKPPPVTEAPAPVPPAADPAPAPSEPPAPAASAPVRSMAPRGPSPLKLLLKLADIMSDLNWVEKRGRNAHFNYDYATESDILAAIRPRLAEKKIFVQTLIEDETITPSGKATNAGVPIMRHRVQLLVIFHDAESGETLDVIGVGYSLDDSDKGFYKAYTGAVKYVFSKTFLVSTGDDPEAEGSEERDEKKKAKREKGAAENQRQDPGRGGNQSLPPEGEQFTVDGPVGAYVRGTTRDQKPRYEFTLTGIGKASTIDVKLGEYLIKASGSGMAFRWSLVRSGSFLNLKGAEPLEAERPY